MRPFLSWIVFLAIGVLIATGIPKPQPKTPYAKTAAMATKPPHQASQSASISAVVVTPTPTPLSTIKPTPQPTTALLMVPTPMSAPQSWDITALVIEKTTARFGTGQVASMLDLVRRESSSNPYAINPSSGACGIPQALPCSKLLAVIESLDNVPGQVQWMVDYVAARYGTPAAAIAHHDLNNWY